MERTSFSPRSLIYFCLFLSVFGALVTLDKGSGLFSQAWPLIILGALAVASILLCARLWSVRRDDDALRRVEARGFYGLLPPRLRDWLFS
jgi:hypothetical protein